MPDGSEKDKFAEKEKKRREGMSNVNPGVPRPQKVQEAVMDYLEGYFGNELNESISDHDIMEAFEDLLETADAVLDYLEEAGMLKKKK